MQVKFRYTRPESLEYNEYFMDCHNANAIQRNRYGLIWWIQLAIVSFIAAIVWFFASWVFAITLIASVLVVVGPSWLFQVRKRFEGDTDEKVMSFSEWGREGFLRETRSSIHWQSFDRVGERDLLFFLHLEHHIEPIPKRLFDETELATFRQWVADIDDTPATGQAKLYSELLSQGPPDFQFDFEHQDLLDMKSEYLEPVSLTPENEIHSGNPENPFGNYVMIVVLLVFLLGLLTHSVYFKFTGFDALVCGVGLAIWIYSINFLSTKLQLHPSEEETAKRFPFENKTVFVKPEGFGVGLPGSIGFFGWRDVVGIWENSHCFQVGVFNDYHLIPKRLFQSEIESKEFLRRLVATREKGRLQPKSDMLNTNSLGSVPAATSQSVNDTVNISNPYQAPATTSLRSSDQPEFLAPASARYAIGIGIAIEMLLLFAVALAMIGGAVYIILQFANSETQLDLPYSILVLAGLVVLAGVMISFGGFLISYSLKGIPLWRHRKDQYQMDETTFWLNGQGFSLSDLRIRANKRLQIAYIVSGDRILTAIDFQYPAYKKTVPLIANEKTDA